MSTTNAGRLSMYMPKSAKYHAFSDVLLKDMGAPWSVVLSGSFKCDGDLVCEDVPGEVEETCSVDILTTSIINVI